MISKVSLIKFDSKVHVTDSVYRYCSLQSNKNPNIGTSLTNELTVSALTYYEENTGKDI